MISTTLCCVEYYILRFWRNFPYRLWELVYRPSRAVAQAILDVAKCLLDEFTKRFLEIFDTVDKLFSKDCRGILLSLGRLVRWETYAAEMAEVSARFFLVTWCRVRGLEHLSDLRTRKAKLAKPRN